MDERLWGIIGGVVLVLALLSPLVLGNRNKVEKFFKAGEEAYELRQYEEAKEKYTQALNEASKPGAKTEGIDEDFTTLIHLKIAWCYYQMAQTTQDFNHYENALKHIREVWSMASVAQHKEDLTYLWGSIDYKTENLEGAKSKFETLKQGFPNSRWVPDARYAIADIYFKEGNYAAAERAFQALVEDFPDIELRYEAAARLEEIKRLTTPESEPEQRRSHADPERDTESPDTETEMGNVYKSPAERAFDKAAALQGQGSTYNAHQLYMKIIEDYGDTESEGTHVARACAEVAKIWVKAGDYVQAREFYEEAMRVTSDGDEKLRFYKAYQHTFLTLPRPGAYTRSIDPTDERFQKARLLWVEKQFLQAAEIYEQLANSELPPDDTGYALYWMGRCFGRAAQGQIIAVADERFRKSVVALKTLLTDYADSTYDIEAYYRLAAAYNDWAEVGMDTSKYQLVINTVDTAFRKYTNSDLNRQGWHNRMLALKDTAELVLNPPAPLPDPIQEEPSVRSQPEQPEKPTQQKPDQSTPVKPSQTRKPSAAGLVHKSTTYLRQGKLEDATKAAKAALKLDPRNKPARDLLTNIKRQHYNEGWALSGEEDYDKAIANYKNALDIDSQFKEAHYELGKIYLEQQRYGEAIDALNQAIALGGEEKETYHYLGLAYYHRKEFAAARRAFNKALAIDPKYQPALHLIDYMDGQNL